MARTRLAPRWLIVPLVFAAVACTKPHEPAKAPAAPVLELRPLTISFRGQTIARLFADGRSESAGPNAPGGALLPGPTFHADGTIALTQPGASARLDPNGDLYVVQRSGSNAREQLFGHISGNQFKFAGSERPWDVRVDGNLVWFGDENSSQIDGEVTPAMRHTVLVMSAAFYVEGVLAASASTPQPRPE